MIGATRLICIDGPAGSGKTTLAATLQVILNASVVHMDDMYNGWNEALVDSTWQRIHHEVLEPLSRGNDAHVDAYDWQRGCQVRSVIPAAEVLIVEGVGSFHPLIADRADDLLWVDVSDDVNMDRVIARDGESVREPMQLFQKQQQEYFNFYRVEERADLRLVGRSGTV